MVNATSQPFYAGKDPVPIVQGAGRAPGTVWKGAENLIPFGFDPRTIQPAATRYTDWAIILKLTFICWEFGVYTYTGLNWFMALFNGLRFWTLDFIIQNVSFIMFLSNKATTNMNMTYDTPCIRHFTGLVYNFLCRRIYLAVSELLCSRRTLIFFCFLFYLLTCTVC